MYVCGTYVRLCGIITMNSKSDEFCFYFSYNNFQKDSEEACKLKIYTRLILSIGKD